MKTCKDIQQQIPEFIDNSLNREQTKIVKQHLKNCSKCRKYYREISNIVEYIGDQNFEIEKNYSTRLLTKLNNKLHTKEKVRYGFKLATSIASIILIITLIFTGFNDGPGQKAQFAEVEVDDQYYDAYLYLNSIQNYELEDIEYYLMADEFEVDISNIAYYFIESKGTRSCDDFITLTGNLSENEFAAMLIK